MGNDIHIFFDKQEEKTEALWKYRFAGESDARRFYKETTLKGCAGSYRGSRTHCFVSASSDGNDG